MPNDGWYEDPQDPSRLRYWDGTGWTDSYAARPDPTAAPGIGLTSRVSGEDPEGTRADQPLGGETAPIPAWPPPEKSSAQGASRQGPPPPDSSSAPLASSPPPPAGVHPATRPASSGSNAVLWAWVVGAVVLLGGCVALANRLANSPSTRPELCEAYSRFASEWFTPSLSDGLFDHGAFTAMDDLADVAKRYPVDSVQADGKALEKLSDGDGGFIVSVSPFEADRSSRQIAAQC
jgi:hypothetical protein